MPFWLVRMATPGAKIYAGKSSRSSLFSMEIRNIHLIMADCCGKSSLSPKNIRYPAPEGLTHWGQYTRSLFSKQNLKFVLLNENEASINSDIDLVPNRRQGIIWTQVSLVCICIYAFLGFKGPFKPMLSLAIENRHACRIQCIHLLKYMQNIHKMMIIPILNGSFII